MTVQESAQGGDLQVVDPIARLFTAQQRGPEYEVSARNTDLLAVLAIFAPIVVILGAIFGYWCVSSPVCTCAHAHTPYTRTRRHTRAQAAWGLPYYLEQHTSTMSHARDTRTYTRATRMLLRPSRTRLLRGLLTHSTHHAPHIHTQRSTALDPIRRWRSRRTPSDEMTAPQAKIN